MATTPVFLPGEFHGQRSLVSYSPGGRKGSDTAEWLTHTHIHTHNSKDGNFKCLKWICNKNFLSPFPLSLSLPLSHHIAIFSIPSSLPLTLFLTHTHIHTWYPRFSCCCGNLTRKYKAFSFSCSPPSLKVRSTHYIFKSLSFHK